MASPRLGVSIPLHAVPLSEHGDCVREIEDLGYTDLWTRETAGCDAFTPLAGAAAWSRSLRLGTAIASVFARGPALLAMEAAALAELAPGRFVLGLGASSQTIVRDWNALPFEAPWARVRDTLRFLRDAFDGKRIDAAYGTFRVRGFVLERPPPEPPPIYLAALGPRMLSLAGREADGVALGLAGPDDVGTLIAEVEASAPGPREVVQRIGVVPIADAERARAGLRRLIAAYLNVEGYAAMHHRLGHQEELGAMWRAWRAGDRRGAAAAVPDRVVDSLFVHGPVEACREQVAAFVEAGVTTPILSVMPHGGDPMVALRGLAPR